MFVLFLYGPPASGKYTIGRIIAEELDLPLFHNHLTVDLVGSLFEFGTPQFVAMREQVWVGAFESAAAEGQSFVFTFNPENTVEPAMLDKLEFAVKGNAGRIVYLELVCSDVEIEKRLSADSRAKFQKLQDVEEYRRLKAGGVFEEPAMPDPLISVDTSDKSARESAALIVSAVREELF